MIDVDSSGIWEKHVFEDTYKEFWIDTVGRSLLFTTGDQIELLQKGDPVETETLIVPPNLGICSFRLFGSTHSQGTG